MSSVIICCAGQFLQDLAVVHRENLIMSTYRLAHKEQLIRRIW